MDVPSGSAGVGATMYLSNRSKEHYIGWTLSQPSLIAEWWARRQIVVFVIGVLLSTWGYPANVTDASTDCSVGSECTVQGELQIYRGLPTSTGVIRLKTDCWLLALPMDVWFKYDRWNKKKVTVTGEAFSNLAASDVIWFEVRDRRVAVGICDSPIVIYVKRIVMEP